MKQALLKQYSIKTALRQLFTGSKNTFKIKAPSDEHRMYTIGISEFGKGVFAKESIAKTDVIMKITGSKVKFNEVVLLGEKESYPFQVGLTEYIAPPKNAVWQLINHSCNPNCGVNENFELIAIQHIERGDELFYDYSTSMLERHWSMKCGCKAENCRHIISDFDTLISERQKYYFQMGVVQKFITQYLYERNS